MKFGETMFNTEKKIISWLEKNRYLLFIAVITVIGLFVRIRGFNFKSLDYKNFLELWFNRTEELGGLNALSVQVGEYSITYQFLIALLTYLPFDSLFCYKILSIVFDYLLAWSVGHFLCVLSGKKDKLLFSLGYSIVLLCPTVVLNSAVWAQCDSIYSFFCVMSLCFLFEKKDIRAFVFLGLAFAFKLQTVFILPFFVYYYFTEKRFSLLHFGISAAAFYASCLPGFIYGRGLLDPIKIYILQTNIYHKVSINIPNLWSLVGGNAYTLSPMATGFALVVFGVVLLLLIGKSGLLLKPERFLALAAWTVWTAVILLPEMHDRYMYLADLLLIALAIINHRYIIFAVASVCVSLITYGIFLYNTDTFNSGLAVFYVIVWAAFSVLQAIQFRKDINSLSDSSAAEENE